jgi:multiple sugar transport system ATP-binding protein
MFSERQDFAPGQRIHLSPQLERVHLFDAESGQRF